MHLTIRSSLSGSTELDKLWADLMRELNNDGRCGRLAANPQQLPDCKYQVLLNLGTKERETGGLGYQRAESSSNSATPNDRIVSVRSQRPIASSLSPSQSLLTYRLVRFTPA